MFSHGNAEDIGTSLPTLESIKGMGFSVFAYDYRGYGTSSGTASEEIVIETPRRLTII
jgi:alpha-beta hydrolase superfamily lysophospholipase